MPVALILAGLVTLFAVLTLRRQYQNWRRVKNDPHMPSDERTYLRKQVYRRIFCGALLLVLAGMIAGTYLSGMEERANQIAARRDAAVANPDQAERPPPSDDDKDFVRLWGGYWIAILILLFVIFSTAIVDIWATRRYALQQLSRIRSDHRTLLERDLAVYRQQRANDRMKPRP
jgi:hypothetical protein